MSSIRQLNKRIKLTRVESKLSLRKFELNIKQFLFSLDKKLNKNPFETMLIITTASLFLNLNKSRVKIIHSLLSFTRSRYLQSISMNEIK